MARMRLQWLTAIGGFLALAGAAVAQEKLAPPVEPPSYPPGVVDVTPSELPPRSYCTDCQMPDSPTPFIISAEYLLVRPRRRDLDFALVDPSNNLAPEGHPASLEWNTRSGLRAGVLWRPRGQLTDIAFTYTYIFSSDDRAVGAPANGVLYAQLTRPGRVDEVNVASASSSLRFNVFDLDFGRTMLFHDGPSARAFMGVRNALVDQSIEAFYDGRDAAQARVRDFCNMDAGGLTFGAESEWSLGGRFSAFGKVRGSILIGEYRVGHRETNFGGNLVNADVHDHFFKPLPTLDMSLGLGYSWKHVRTSIGYELSHWFNQVEGIGFADDFSEGKRFRKQSDLGLEAVFFRFEYLF